MSDSAIRKIQETGLFDKLKTALELYKGTTSPDIRLMKQATDIIRQVDFFDQMSHPENNKIFKSLAASGGVQLTKAEKRMSQNLLWELQNTTFQNLQNQSFRFANQFKYDSRDPLKTPLQNLAESYAERSKALILQRKQKKEKDQKKENPS